MPAVAEALRRELGLEAELHDPDLAVARGAALFGEKKELERMVAADLRTRGRLRDGAPLEDAVAPDLDAACRRVAEAYGVPLSQLRRAVEIQVDTVVSRGFGVLAVNSFVGQLELSWLVHRNDRLPLRTSRSYGTMRRDQEVIQVTVVEQQGQVESSRPEDAKILIVGEITGIPPGYDEGSEVRVTFEMGFDGVLRVTAFHVDAGIPLQLTATTGAPCRRRKWRVSVTSSGRSAIVSDHVVLPPFDPAWQRQRDHPKYRVLVALLVQQHAARSAELLDAGRRRVAAMRVRAQREQRDAARYELLDAAISRLVQRHQGIPADKVEGLHEVDALAGLNRAEVEVRLRRHRVLPAAAPAAEPSIGAGRCVRCWRSSAGSPTNPPRPPCSRCSGWARTPLLRRCARGPLPGGPGPGSCRRSGCGRWWTSCSCTSPSSSNPARARCRSTSRPSQPTSPGICARGSAPPCSWRTVSSPTTTPPSPRRRSRSAWTGGAPPRCSPRWPPSSGSRTSPRTSRAALTHAGAATGTCVSTAVAPGWPGSPRAPPAATSPVAGRACIGGDPLRRHPGGIPAGISVGTPAGARPVRPAGAEGRPRSADDRRRGPRQLDRWRRRGVPGAVPDRGRAVAGDRSHTRAQHRGRRAPPTGPVPVYGVSAAVAGNRSPEARSDGQAAP
jgi:hypothetical protein